MIEPTPQQNAPIEPREKAEYPEINYSDDRMLKPFSVILEPGLIEDHEDYEGGESLRLIPPGQAGTRIRPVPPEGLDSNINAGPLGKMCIEENRVAENLPLYRIPNSSLYILVERDTGWLRRTIVTKSEAQKRYPDRQL